MVQVDHYRQGQEGRPEMGYARCKRVRRGGEDRFGLARLREGPSGGGPEQRRGLPDPGVTGQGDGKGAVHGSVHHGLYGQVQ